VHLPTGEAGRDVAKGLQASLSRFFAYRADVLGRDLKEFFRIGWIALLVGLAVLSLPGREPAVADWTSTSYFHQPIGESLIIVGWVANWRPIEISLHDGWPLWRRRNLYRRFAAATVTIKPNGA
jgi:hypothetical protein